MSVRLLKQLAEAKGHLKRAAVKMDVTAKHKATDHLMYTAQINVVTAINNLEKALKELEKGC